MSKFIITLPAREQDLTNRLCFCGKECIDFVTVPMINTIPAYLSVFYIKDQVRGYLTLPLCKYHLLLFQNGLLYSHNSNCKIINNERLDFETWTEEKLKEYLLLIKYKPSFKELRLLINLIIKYRSNNA
jgi:hypothetical protein